MKSGKQKLRLRPTALRDARGDRQLWVWGDLPAWLLVDEELADFLGRCDGRRELRELYRAHAKAWNKPLPQVRAEADPIVADLIARKILGVKLEAYAPAPEALRIANLTFNITNRCNLRCPWCYNAKRDTEELPVARIFDALSEARELFDPQASFIVLGGEPFLVAERLFETIARAEKLFGEPILVSTNGTRVSDEHIAQLRDHRVEVQVSIDSHLAERHDAARGQGVFAKAADAAQRLVAGGIHTIVSMVYSAADPDPFESYLEMALELGVNEARFIPLRTLGGGRAFDCNRPNQATMLENLLAALDRRPEFRPLLARDYFSISARILATSTARTGCGVGRQVLFLDADGALYPCPNHVSEAHRLGVLGDAPLEDLFVNAPVMSDFRARYRLANYAGCQTCAFRHWCAGDCRGETLVTTGDALAPSPYCESLKPMFLRLLWLLAEGDARLNSQNPPPVGVNH